MKRILYLTDNFPPEVNAPAIRARDHIKYLQLLGHDVDLITCQPNYPLGIIFKGCRNDAIKVEALPRGHVFRVWTFMAPNEGILKRLIDHLSFMFSSIILGLNLHRKGRRYDVILSTSPQYFSIVSGVILAKIYSAHSIVEIRDLWPETIKNTLSINRFSVIYDIFHALSRYIYKTADKIIPVTHGFGKYIEQNNRLKRKITVVENSIDTFSSASIIPYRKRRNSKINICYVGTLGVAQNIPELIRVLYDHSYVRENEIHLHIAGAGMHGEEVQALAKNCEHIDYYGMLRREEAYSLIIDMDLALIPLINEASYATIIPSKIFEVAALGIPILITNNCEGAEIVKQYSAGEIFEYGNIESINNAIIRVYKAGDHYLSGLSDIAKVYTREKKVKALSGAIESL